MKHNWIEFCRGNTKFEWCKNCGTFHIGSKYYCPTIGEVPTLPACTPFRKEDTTGLDPSNSFCIQSDLDEAIHILRKHRTKNAVLAIQPEGVYVVAWNKKEVVE